MFKNAFYFVAGSATTLVAAYSFGSWMSKNRPEFMHTTIKNHGQS